MQYKVTQTIQSVRIDGNAPVDVTYYTGDSHAKAIIALSQATDVNDPGFVILRSVRLDVTYPGHVEQTGCGLTREDFHPDGDEPCVDGGQPDEHPVSGNAEPNMLHRAAYNLLGDGNGNEWERNPEYTRAVFELIADTAGLGLNVADDSGEIERLIRLAGTGHNPNDDTLCKPSRGCFVCDEKRKP